MWNSLTEARRQSGLSQQEVAEALDVSRQAVSRWETGAAAPSTENLVELARLYGATLDALVNGTSLLKDIATNAPVRAIGKNTVESMQSGVVFGAASMLDGMVERFEAELGPAKTLVATGGAAGIVVPHCRHSVQYVPTLILDGLYAVYCRTHAAL